MGIDPGTSVMGYGIIAIKENSPELVGLGVLKLEKYDDHSLRLKKIFERTLSLIDEFKPECIAIEAPFFGKNIQSMLKLGRAQGVAIASAMYRNIPIAEYSPRKIKQSITGNGNASKEQVAAMLKTILKFSEDPVYLDASDGLAAAVCHYFNRLPDGLSQGRAGRSSGGWKSFIKENPGRSI